MTTKTKTIKVLRPHTHSNVESLAELENHMAELLNDHIMPMINDAMVTQWGNGIVVADTIVTIEDAGKRQCLGSFQPEAYSNSKDARKAQLKIVAEHLNRGVYGSKGVAETLVHEGCHLAGHQRYTYTGDDRDRDCTKDAKHRPTGNGDNSHFETIATASGLIVSKGNKGMNVTEASEDLQAWFHTLPIKEELFDIFRIEQQSKPKSKSNHIKYECGCSSFRATKEVDATCNACGNYFMPAE